MKIKCDRCKKEYQDLFDTLVRYDYVEPGRGKPEEYHICLECRKELKNWFESDIKTIF